MDSYSQTIITPNPRRVKGLVRRVPGDLITLVPAKIENLRADNNVTRANVPLQSATETGADHQIGPVAANGHLGGNAGAFLADPQRQQGNGLTAERALVEIEMFLADDVIGIRPAQDGPQLLTNGNENGNHGSRS